MKLKAVVDSLDGIDAKYHELYVQQEDGSYRLDVDGVAEHPDVTALKNAHERSKARVRELVGENTTLKAKVEDLPDDFDADLYARAVEHGVGNGQGGGKLPNEAEVRREAAEAQKAKSDKEWGKKLDPLTADRDRLKARVERDERDKALNTALDAAKVTDPAYRAGARALLATAVKVVETDGQYEALATDPDLGDIPVAEYVKTWAGTDQGKAFVGAPNSAGGGANGGGQGDNVPDSTNNPWKAKTFNATEQARLRRENPGLAQRLAAEAGVKLR